VAPQRIAESGGSAKKGPPQSSSIFYMLTAFSALRRWRGRRQSLFRPRPADQDAETEQTRQRVRVVVVAGVAAFSLHLEVAGLGAAAQADLHGCR